MMLYLCVIYSDRDDRSTNRSPGLLEDHVTVLCAAATEILQLVLVTRTSISRIENWPQYKILKTPPKTSTRVMEVPSSVT